MKGIDLQNKSDYFDNENYIFLYCCIILFCHKGNARTFLVTLIPCINSRFIRNL